MKVTYYLEVISSWCYWAEPAWAELKRRYAGKAAFGWKLALMDASGLPVSRPQCEWFYRRSGTIMRATTREFHALQVNQRPTFVVENSIGDRAVFSGLAVAAPLAAAIDAMLDDAAAYASHAAHFGSPPAG